MDTRHLDPLRDELRASKVVAPPQPWRKISDFAVGGLRSVGFDRESELLLVVSSAGRGVIDCQSGVKVARDDAEYYENEAMLEAEGIGPLEGRTLRISGLLGGGLPRGTSDGWSIETVYLNWPVAETLLLEPFASLYDSLRKKPSRFHRINSESEIRASGFSYSGRTLIIATSSGIAIYGRDAG
jgi:hypothetical protein